MIYTLTGNELSVSVQNTGMELCSVKTRATDIEYIWQANTDIWGSHAPVLFPIVGALKNGQYQYDGQIYSLPKHGIIRYNEDIELIEKTSSILHFSLSWSDETLEHYPFKFEFQTRYRLSGSTLHVTHTVINKDRKDILFSLGGHPAFNCPLFEGESYSDYYLDFETPESEEASLLNSSGLISSKTVNVFDEAGRLNLHKHLFNNDALIFRNLNSRSVSLVSKKTGPALTVAFDGFPYLGVWAKPGAPFVCIEPWQGLADIETTTQNFEEKEGLLSLKSGQTHEASYSMTFHM